MEINTDSEISTKSLINTIQPPHSDFRKYRWFALILSVIGGIGPYFSHIFTF